MGGTTIEAPKQPSVQSSIADWVANYPAVFNLQQQYAPQEAAQQLALAQQYAAPMGAALREAQEQIYPTETALTESLAQQTQAGMTSDVPDWMKDQYLSDIRANLGTNIGSPIGADYTSRSLLQQRNDWQNYYRNMGLSIAGRQPVYQAQTPQYTNQVSGFTPQGVMGFNQQGYGTAANIFGTQQQAASQGNPYFNSLAGIAGMGLGAWGLKHF